MPMATASIFIVFCLRTNETVKMIPMIMTTTAVSRLLIFKAVVIFIRASFMDQRNSLAVYCLHAFRVSHIQEIWNGILVCQPSVYCPMRLVFQQKQQ